MKQKNLAFTLAEVLITLAIIGIVAALTIPVLLQNYKKNVVATKLKQFYSIMNQAIQMSELQNGFIRDDSFIWHAQDEPEVDVSAENELWFKKYLAPYIKAEKYTNNLMYLPQRDKNYSIYRLSNGDYFGIDFASNREWIYIIGDVNKCFAREDNLGTCIFPFLLTGSEALQGTDSWKYHRNKLFEPYKWNWDGEIESLYDSSEYGCKNGEKRLFCTALIQQNNWEIPDDYPLKF